MGVPVRSGLQPGMTVDIVLKKDQRTGTLTRGVIARLLTKSPQHPHGIKVMLEDGAVGRVKKVVTADIDNDNEQAIPS